MRKAVFCILLVALASVAMAEGAIEVSLVQSTFVGKPFAGSVGSIRLCTATAPQPFGEIGLFADGGIKLSETTENSLTGFLVGASTGPVGSKIRVGAGWQYPDSQFVLYTRTVLMSW